MYFGMHCVFFLVLRFSSFSLVSILYQQHPCLCLNALVAFFDLTLLSSCPGSDPMLFPGQVPGRVRSQFPFIWCHLISPPVIIKLREECKINITSPWYCNDGNLSLVLGYNLRIWWFYDFHILFGPCSMWRFPFNYTNRVNTIFSFYFPFITSPVTPIVLILSFLFFSLLNSPVITLNISWFSLLIASAKLHLAHVSFYFTLNDSVLTLF